MWLCRLHQPRAVKKNNFFNTSGSTTTRMGDDFSDLCVESSSHKSKTITLQLQNGSQQNERKSSTTTTTAPSLSSASVSTHTSGRPTAYQRQPQKSTKSAVTANDKLYRSATQLSSNRPIFTNISSYLQFNTNRRQGLYTSEIYLDRKTRHLNGVLKPLDSNNRSTNNVVEN
jgi:hypothetical protein